MKSIDAVKVLHQWDLKNRFLFRSRELGLLFDERGNTLRSTIKRLLSDEVLKKVAHDVYLYGFCHVNSSLIGSIAVFLRPGEFTYESLESAGSQWGIISQVPLGRITCVTTGNSGEVKTPYGVIEYDHTDEGVLELARDTAKRQPYNDLPIASKSRTVRDLVAYGRSIELIDWEEAEDED